MLSGNKIKLVSSMRYLGSWLNDKLNANTHIEKKYSAAFAALKRIKKLGFNSVHTDCKLKGTMYKIYVRTAALYGIETFTLTENNSNKIAKLETKIIKSMMGLTKCCLNTDLMRALNIELTEEKLKINKLNFLTRIMSNTFTKDLYGELKALKITNSYPLQIEDLLKPLGEIKFHDGRVFTEEEKAKLLSSTLKTFGDSEAQKSIQVKNINKIFKYTNKEAIPHLLYFYLNSKGSDTFWHDSTKTH